MRLFKLATAALLFFSIVGFSAYDRDNMMYQAAATVHRVLLPDGSGSAVAIRAGTAVVAAHVVVDGIEDMTIKGYEAESIEYVDFSDKVDLAIVSVPGLLCPCAELARTSPFYLEEVLSVGYPLGMGIKVTTEGRYQGDLNDERHLFTAPGIFGNSGGGIFNEEGALVAILTGGAFYRIPGAPHLPAAVPHLAFATPIKSVKEVLLCADSIGLCDETP